MPCPAPNIPNNKYPNLPPNPNPYPNPHINPNLTSASSCLNRQTVTLTLFW